MDDGDGPRLPTRAGDREQRDGAEARDRDRDRDRLASRDRKRSDGALTEERERDRDKDRCVACVLAPLWVLGSSLRCASASVCCVRAVSCVCALVRPCVASLCPSRLHVHGQLARCAVTAVCP